MFSEHIEGWLSWMSLSKLTYSEKTHNAAAIVNVSESCERSRFHVAAMCTGGYRSDRSTNWILRSVPPCVYVRTWFVHRRDLSLSEACRQRILSGCQPVNLSGRPTWTSDCWFGQFNPFDEKVSCYHANHILIILIFYFCN